MVLLATSQVCSFATAFLFVFFGPFAMIDMGGGAALGGLPFAIAFLATPVATIPAGRLMDRVGRAPILAAGHAAGAAGAIAVAAALAGRSAGLLAMAGFLGGLFLLSAGVSVTYLGRLAAADLYPPSERARAISRLVLASFLGSLVGGGVFNVLSASGEATPAQGYLAMVPFFVAGAVAMLFARRDLVGRGSPGVRGRFVSVLRRPGVPWVVAGNAGAQGGMGGVMSIASATLAPMGGMSAAGILVGHFAGMFLPSPIAGRIADRRSRALAIGAGGLTLALGALLFTRTDVGLIAGAGLFLVGAGWCFTYVPGTAVLADATAVEERGTLFGANDAIVSVVGATVVLVAGAAFAAWGSVGLGVVGAACGLLPLAAGLIVRRPSPRVPQVTPSDP